MSIQREMAQQEVLMCVIPFTKKKIFRGKVVCKRRFCIGLESIDCSIGLGRAYNFCCDSIIRAEEVNDDVRNIVCIHYACKVRPWLQGRAFQTLSKIGRPLIFWVFHTFAATSPSQHVTLIRSASN